MDYFYAAPDQVQGSSILLTGEESKHLARVLRKAVGETVFITDGRDRMFEAVIEAVGKESTRCRVVREEERLHEAGVDVTLAVSLLRNPARFDVLVEKATELGVRRIAPLLCERTVPKKGRSDRLRHIALSAMKQSGRSWLPPVEDAAPFSAFIREAGEALRLLPHEGTAATETLEAAAAQRGAGQTVVIVVGPEGGFTEGELRRAEEAGYRAVSLGERRLRSETAAIAAVARVLR